MRRALVLGPLACAFVAFLGVLSAWRPFLVEDRDVVTATPSLAGIFQRDTIDVPRRHEACIAPVPFATDTRRVRIIVVGPRGAGPIAVRATAGRWSAVATAGDVGQGADVPITVTLPSSPAVDAVGSVCVGNRGRTKLALVGTAEGRSDAPARTTVDGAPQPDAALTLLTEGRASLLSRFGTVIGHASDLAGGLVPTALLWLVFPGLLVGVLAGVPWALWRALRDDVG